MDFDSYGTDKESEHSYFSTTYNALFSSLRDKAVNLLELGLWGGGCLRMWGDYFPNPDSRVTGVDVRPIDPSVPDGERIAYYQGDQSDEPLMEKIGEDRGPFDIIIDDASHSGHESMASIILLWKHLKPGGIYVIEDIFYAWPEFHGRARDGDGKMLGCLHFLLNELPLFCAHTFHINYRLASGVAYLIKSEDATTPRNPACPSGS